MFDRSWYNRAGVERVMGFCTEEEYQYFMNNVNVFEKMLIDDGIILIKYWFSISDKVQEERFQNRITDPLKRWKLSPMDLESRARWEEYTKAKDAMIERTNTKEAPWYFVMADNKRKARLNCIAHLLSQVPYQDLSELDVELPKRKESTGYQRKPIPLDNIVPEKY